MYSLIARGRSRAACCNAKIHNAHLAAQDGLPYDLDASECGITTSRPIADMADTPEPSTPQAPPPPPAPVRSGESNPRTITDAIVRLLNPITLIALIILVSVLVLIGAGLFGFDKGNILSNLAKSDYARGLITYLFAVGTIGTAVALVLAALLGDDDIKEKFARGKEVLSILIGMFGTMVGFYFGSQVAKVPEKQLSLAPVIVSDSTALPGGTVGVITWVVGGTPPYRYWVSTDSTARPDYNLPVGTDGWIRAQVVVPKVTPPQSVPVRVAVRDASGEIMQSQAVIIVSAVKR